MQIKFKRLPHGEGLPLPTYATHGAAGMDLRAAENITVGEGRTEIIRTGLAVEIPDGWELQVRSRSGLAAHDISVLNSPGTIDSDYRGEIMVIVRNHSMFSGFHIFRGDRIAQLILAPVTRAEPIEVEELSETERGENGLGSTGK